MEEFVNYEIMEKNEPGCKSCKNKYKLGKEHTLVLILAIFMIVTSVYGTIQLVKDIANFFASIS
jgi:hypothetical protein